MYLKVEGNIDCSILATDLSENKPVSKENLKRFFENGVEVYGFVMDEEVEKIKIKASEYDKLHPKMVLTEDWVDNSITDSYIERVFSRFIYPLDTDHSRLTIVDPYIYSSGVNVDLLVNILNNNVSSKQVRFIRNSSKDDESVKNLIKQKLSMNGFDISDEDKSDIHDRWWYTRVSGFTTGISFNGLKRKSSTINMLNSSDLNEIINKYGI